MSKQYGLPYMGSKRKLASKIVDKILEENPNTEYVYDLFGGGGAISFEFLQREKIRRVVYNEKNAGVVALLRDIKENGITEKYYKWIDRDTFNKHKNDDDWFGGLCKVVWSFGNNQKDYLFGKNIEELKRLGHEYVVNRDPTIWQVLGIDAPHDSAGDSIKERRSLLMAKVRENKKNRYDLQQLQRLQQLLQLERLQQLERLERLEQLELICNDYKDVKIETPIETTVIYLDPPYKATTRYALDIDHDELFEWIKNSKYKIYVSSYEYDLPCVAEFKHRSSLSASANNGVVEKLFKNR